MSEITKDLPQEAGGIPRKWIILGVVKVVVLLIAVGVVFSIYGCNTMRGIGQDIERAGEAIQKSSNK
ncbi:MAG: entericidin A/B family lipoprotein [Pseudomonadota bacterium]